MTWAVDTRPGQVLHITKMVDDKGDELGLGEGGEAWGIVLDGDSMMVFRKIDQKGYPGAKGEAWTSRVYPTNWADEGSDWAKADDVPDDVPREFWPIAARAALNGGA